MSIPLSRSYSLVAPNGVVLAQGSKEAMRKAQRAYPLTEAGKPSVMYLRGAKVGDNVMAVPMPEDK